MYNFLIVISGGSLLIFTWSSWCWDLVRVRALHRGTRTNIIDVVSWSATELTRCWQKIRKLCMGCISCSTVAFWGPCSSKVLQLLASSMDPPPPPLSCAEKVHNIPPVFLNFFSREHLPARLWAHPAMPPKGATYSQNRLKSNVGSFWSDHDTDSHSSRCHRQGRWTWPHSPAGSYGWAWGMEKHERGRRGVGPRDPTTLLPLSRNRALCSLPHRSQIFYP